MHAEEKAALAKGYFTQGYNCAQAVALAFCEEAGLARMQAVRLVSALGGGMGRMREVCGAVSAMFLIWGSLYGYERPEQAAEKAALYQEVRMLAARFSALHGSLLCRDLLMEGSTGGAPEPHADGDARRRPCACYVGHAARILAEAIIDRES